MVLMRFSRVAIPRFEKSLQRQARLGWFCISGLEDSLKGNCQGADSRPAFEQQGILPWHRKMSRAQSHNVHVLFFVLRRIRGCVDLYWRRELELIYNRR